jgi:hypothetical protein
MDGYGSVPALIQPFHRGDQPMSFVSSVPDLVDPFAPAPLEPDVPNAGHIIVDPPDDGPIG